MAQIDTGNMTQEQKEKNVIIMYIAMAAANIIYFIVCELILKYGFNPGQHGFAPQKLETYSMIKTVLIMLSIVETVFLAGIKLAVSSGNASGIAKVFLNNLMKPTADDMAMVMIVTLNITSFCLSIGIYGVLIFMLNGIIADTYIFFILCEVIILMFIPSKTYIEKLINLRKNMQQMGS